MDAVSLLLISHWFPLPVLSPAPCSYLHLDSDVPALQNPAVGGDLGAAQRQALNAVERHRLSGLNDNVRTCDGDGRSLVTWRHSDVTER